MPITDAWPVRPMEPVLREDAFDDADTLFQVKWDGVRLLAYAYPAGVRLYNRRMHERTRQYPELIEALSGLPAGTVLDGEAVAPGPDGKPDFPRVLRRDLLLSAGRIARAVDSVRVDYMVFDILWMEGKELCPLPLAERLEILGALRLDSDTLHRVESVPGDGRALFRVVCAEGLEGVVAKKTDSPYLTGRKSDLWQKVKCFREVTALAGGYLADDAGRVKSLLAGVLQEDGLWYIGTAGSGLTRKQIAALGAILPGIRGECPFLNPPSVAGALWVKPLVKMNLQFLEYTGAGVMRAPSVKGFPEGIV